MATIISPFPQISATSALPAVTATGLTTRELVSEIHISPAAGNTGVIHVYDVATSIVLKDLLAPANGHTESWCLKSGEGEDGIDPTKIGVAISTGGDKANAYAVIR